VNDSTPLQRLWLRTLALTLIVDRLRLLVACLLVNDLACLEALWLLSITFSNRVEDITQRLGTIDLPQTDDTDDVNLFEWALQAIEKRDGLGDEVTSLRRQIKGKDEVVASLQNQIDELVEAKAEHETQMLAKFTLLLNEKKLKIRNGGKRSKRG